MLQRNDVQVTENRHDTIGYSYAHRVLQDPPPTIHLPQSPSFVACEASGAWEQLATDTAAWQRWSGGGGDACLNDRIDSSLPSTYYLSDDTSAGLWIGKEADDDGAYRIALMHNGVHRRITSIVFDAIVRALWAIDGRRVNAHVSMQETTLLIMLSRGLFLTEFENSVNAFEPELSIAETVMTRYNPEVSHARGPVW